MTDGVSLYGVVLEVDIEDLLPDVQIVIMEALTPGSLNRWDGVPGLLCAVGSTVERPYVPTSWSCWSRIHGFFNADLDTFEREYLPFVLGGPAIRVRRMITSTAGVGVLERWMWWPGSTVEEMFLNLSAALVMES